MSEPRKRIKAPVPDGWQEVAAAVREVRDQLRESFGPRREVRLVTNKSLNNLLDRIVAERGTEETGKAYAAALVEQEKTGAPVTFVGDPNDLAKIRRIPFEPPEQRMLREVRDRVLELCGWEDGAETTAGGSQDNDLAAERADAVMAFLGLARGHSLPNKLLPRGEHPGDWLTPGTEVTVLGQHPAVVMPRRDMVTVKLEGSDVVTEFPRMSITKRGEAWTPPKRTDD